MDVEETKKIIQSKIEAEAVTKQVRNEIKSYIHEKQNLREGFKESLEPLITSQDKVKESIDKQQNAMIEQLQKNQLALTEGLDKNRLAITQGFDKMDEVKKWDLQQLPGYEAIEDDDDDGYKTPMEEYEDEEVTVRLPPREEPKKRVVTYSDTDLDKGLTNDEAVKILKNLNLQLPRLKMKNMKLLKKI